MPGNAYRAGRGTGGGRGDPGYLESEMILWGKNHLRRGKKTLGSSAFQWVRYRGGTERGSLSSAPRSHAADRGPGIDRAEVTRRRHPIKPLGKKKAWNEGRKGKKIGRSDVGISLLSE